MKKDWMPRTDMGKVTMLNNIASKLGGYTTTLGLLPADVAAVVADNTYVQFIWSYCVQFSARQQDVTAHKTHTFIGPADEPLLFPGGMTPGPVPPITPPDVFGRLRKLVQRLKAHPNYTTAIGLDLGIEATEITVDIATAKPSLILSLQGGKVNVGWKKSEFTSLEIWVNRAAGWVFLSIDSLPDYLDNAAMPPAGQGAVWQYKAMYRLGDELVGLWSDVSSINVGT